MTRREQYNLIFENIYIEGFKSAGYNVRAVTVDMNDISSLILPFMLSGFDEYTYQEPLNEIANAENGMPYDDELLVLDSRMMDNVGVKVSPPNIDIIYGDDALQMPMQDFKELVNEWLDFQEISR